MEKRGQLSIIVVIAIIVFVVLLLLFLFRNKMDLSVIFESKIHPEVRPVYETIDSCVEQRSIDAIRLVGLQGGYLHPKDYVETELHDVSYGLKNKRKVLASKETIENEIKTYVEATIIFCLDSEELGYNITERESEVEVKIMDDGVEIKAKMPISVIKKEGAFEIDKSYEHEIPIRLGNILSVANEIIEKHLADPNYIDITYLASLEYDVIFAPYDESTLIYSITDDETIGEIPYTFVFGIDLE